MNNSIIERFIKNECVCVCMLFRVLERRNLIPLERSRARTHALGVHNIAHSTLIRTLPLPVVRSANFYLFARVEQIIISWKNSSCCATVYVFSEREESHNTCDNVNINVRFSRCD